MADASDRDDDDAEAVRAGGRRGAAGGLAALRRRQGKKKARGEAQEPPPPAADDEAVGEPEVAAENADALVEPCVAVWLPVFLLLACVRHSLSSALLWLRPIHLRLVGRVVVCMLAKQPRDDEEGVAEGDEAARARRDAAGAELLLPWRSRVWNAPVTLCVWCAQFEEARREELKKKTEAKEEVRVL